MSHEDYIDSTQRAFINGMSVMKQAGSFGHADDIDRPSGDSPRNTPTSSRQNSLADGGPMPSRKNSLPVGTHVTSKSPSSPSMSVPRRPDSMSSGISPSTSFFGGNGRQSPQEEKKKKLGGLFTMKRRDSDKRGSTQPI
jgi:hypothetical protein